MTLRAVSSTRNSTKSTTEECLRQTLAEACSSWHTVHTDTDTQHDYAYCIMFVFVCALRVSNMFNCTSEVLGLRQVVCGQRSHLPVPQHWSGAQVASWSSAGHDWPWPSVFVAM